MRKAIIGGMNIEDTTSASAVKVTMIMTSTIEKAANQPGPLNTPTGVDT